jgi:SAM-dependent methyltransferase
VSRCLNCGAGESDHWAWAHDIEYHSSAERWEYRRCRTCGVLFLPEPPVGRLAEIYPPSYYSFRGGTRGSAVQRIKARLDQRMLRRVLAGVPGETLSLLDVGGGTGALASAARVADGRVTSTRIVDLDERCRAEAEAAGHGFTLSRIEELSTDERFDAILALNLIEHVSEPRTVLERFAGLLRPRGRLLLKTPNVDALDARLFRHQSWGGYHCPRHWVLFHRGALVEAAQASGLAVERWHYTQGAPFWTVSILGALERRGWFVRETSVPMVDHPLFPAVAGLTATFDFARRPFAPTSQLVMVLTAAPGAARS